MFGNLKRILARVGIRIERIYPPDPDPVDLYFQMGCPPWSNGYCIYKERSIRKALADSEMMALFHADQRLPDGYGYAVDERIVEYPWLLANLPEGDLSLFDAGAALNHEFVVAHPKMANKKLTIMTLSPEDQCYWQHGVSYLYGDLCAIPLQGELFDAVVSISTLEHIGFDNTLFSSAGDVQTVDEKAYLQCLGELHRILKRGGTLHLTVPYGTAADAQTFKIFNAQRLAELKSAWPGICQSEIFYRYHASGWQVCDQAACEDAEYVDWFMRLPEDRPAEFPRQKDGALAARAVSMLVLKK